MSDSKQEELVEKIKDAYDEIAEISDLSIVLDLDKLHKKGEFIDKKNIKEAYLCKKKIIRYLKQNPNALGVAAHQLGHSLKMFGIREYEGVELYINPMIVQKIKPSTNTSEHIEECLSLPDRSFKVKRYLGLKVRYQDTNLKWKEKTIRDFRAIIFQHELDHTNGILISDIGEEVLEKSDYNF